ncbi:hypothetical protein C2845_PM03G26240 [Panicum miliaceum]|uniref:DUF1618 domain-containing protein n=1 Tax=Panicum miliaceum TaxID=4540 RepID=A0A3L6TE06_PANMI|nr:hypothetical protein C2845_PM03G26240 [Panicum miliaceum]
MPRTAARCPDHPPWVLLDTAARIGRCENATTATAKTSAGDDIAVSFSVTRPPGLSSCFVHCPGLPAEAFACQPQVTGADGALLLVSVMFAERHRIGMFTDVFAYHASGPGEPPSLHLLPRPYPVRLHYDHVGVLSRGGHHLVVVPQPRFRACGRWEYDLHVFSTETMSWSTTVAPVAVDGDTDYDLLARHAPTKVVPVGGVGLGWVDLRRGVLLGNDVADERPEVRLVQLPSLMRTNRADFG